MGGSEDILLVDLFSSCWFIRAFPIDSASNYKCCNGKGCQECSSAAQPIRGEIDGCQARSQYLASFMPPCNGRNRPPPPSVRKTVEIHVWKLYEMSLRFLYQI